MNTYISGTCQEMCPMSEVNKRSREKLVHYFEKDAVFVKEFSRSAAGRVQPKPEDLRTRSALEKTFRYLLTDIVTDTRKPFYIRYEFIFDRLRSVRQEMVIQNLEMDTVIKILEPTIMFLAYSRYHLIGESINNFDPKINDQHLQECLKKLLVCYDTVTENQERPGLLNNRIKFETLYILFNLGSVESLVRSFSLPEKLKHDPQVMFVTKIAVSFWTRNYYRVLTMIQQLPGVLRAVASLHIPLIRTKLLEIFATAYHNKQLTVPLSWLKTVLLYESNDSLISDLKYFKFEITDDKRVKMDKTGFDKSKPTLPNVKFRFIDCELEICDIPSLILGLTDD